ncbi:MAG: GldG family protein, partial [Polyangiaceae bacterium]|nr:GldG family protein [Polyangiaceae bacterium]
LSEYERASGGKFKYTLIEPATDDERKQAVEAGLQEQPFGEADATGDDRASITQGFLGLVFKYGSEKAVIPALHPAYNEGLEFFISNKIREIRDKNDDIKHKIGLITGKGELKLSDRNLVPRQGQQGSPSLQEIITQNFPFYALENVDLQGGATEINQEFEGLIITQPSEDFSEKELRRIDQFMMSGGKTLAVIASAVNLKPNDASMMAELNTHGLDPLLSGYGIQMNQDAVLDHGAQFRVPVMTQMGGVGWLRHPGIAHVVNDPRFAEEEQLLDTSFPGFFRMDELMMPFPSSLSLLGDKQPEDVSVRALIRTTPGTNLMTDATVDMSLQDQWRPQPPFEQAIIAAAAEGKLRSAFAGSPDAEIPAGDRAPEAGGVLVIASGEFITNPFAYSGNGPEPTGQMAQFGAMGGDRELQMVAQTYAQQYLRPTILALKNIFDWMSGDADLIAASAKILGEPNLTYASVAKPEFSMDDSEEAIAKKDEEYRTARRSL